jgi:hypothetical protein
MTTHTRRRVIVGAVALLLALPTETILLKALTTPTTKAAAQQWAGGLSVDQLSAAATSIQAYPFAYRKAIMGRLPAATQSYVWQSHIQSYLANNPNINPDAVDALNEVLTLLTPDHFGRPATDAERSEIQVLADRVVADLGQDTAKYLMYYLGPAQSTVASAEPITDKISNFLRDKLIVLARAGDCSCNTGFGCGGANCSGGSGCSPTSDWPACGWLWDQTCDGSCDGGKDS